MADEKQRVQAAGGEVLEVQGSTPLVRKPVRPRLWESVEGGTQEEEVRRILEGTFDSFATLSFGPEDTIDGKSARSSYKRLALKVHPDKAPEDLKARAKEAFEKIEKPC
ncbi:unnamed protein product [Polarella glacialis]|uniref:J domain-containing protein n=1 Tax=Polarella glacialis TaxID=89957 RepID=A0A813IZ06_POLGL|nr:unnamed protein product [Polarella glacialis]